MKFVLLSTTIHFQIMRLNHFHLTVAASPTNVCRLLIGKFSKPCFLMLATCWLLAEQGLQAQTTWNGSASTDWSTDSNWSAGVPDPTDDVTIPNANNKPVIGAGTAAVAKSVRITVAAAKLTISSTASLSINGSTGFALENFGTLDNSGTIQIGNVSSVANRGIVHRNGGTLNNKPSSLIQIDQTSAAEAFYSTGIVNNEGSIQIGSNAAVVGHGIRIEGNTFNNKPGGSINIDRASVHGIDLAATTTPAPVLNNEGSIQIGSQANVTGLGMVIRAGCTVNNKPGGSVTIDRTGVHGIELTGASAVLNNEALIQIGTQANVAGTAIVNRGGCTFNNKVGGDISINQVNGSIYNNGTFSNNALITIDNDTRKAQDGIFNESSGNFSNNATGIISIKKPWGNGIWNNFGNFINAGKITIRDIFNKLSGDYSTGILNYGTFSSTSSAEIHLDEVGGGIISIGAVTNAGIIRMGENAALSAEGIINLQATGVFNNNAGGDIRIKQTAKGAVRNDAPSSFFNNACAQLDIFGNLNNSGTFTNAGLFRVNATAQAHVNTALTNNGVIEYVQGAVIIPNVTNNDVVVKSITGECTVPNVLSLGGMNSFTVGTTWYTDPALTIPSGTYNQAANSFSYNQSLVEGPYTLYFAVSDGANGCTRTVSIRLTYDDVTKPTITCPPTQSISATPGQCTGIATFSPPTGADNCALANPPVTLIGGPASGSPFPKGITIVTFQATDATGLTKTCTFRVTVNDIQAPTITCPSNQSLNTDLNLCSAVATYTNATFTDNCAPTTGTAIRISGLVSGSAFPVGNSNVVFQATDAAGNTRRCTMVVTVTDNQPPVVTCPQPIVVTGSGTPCTSTVIYANATASDNCTGTLTPFLLSGLASGSVFPAGVTTNTFRAVAPNGQSAVCSFTVTVNCGSGMSNADLEDRDKDLEALQTMTYKTSLGLTIAPNPAMSFVTMGIEGVDANGGTLLVFDPIGRLVQQQVIASDQRTTTLQVAEFAPGLYRIMLKTGDGMVTKTLVVVKE
jgi:hypothetical protein